MASRDVERQVREQLARFAAERGLDIRGGTMRRTSSRFCLGVEHGDYNGTELFGVGTDRFIWLAYKPNGTDRIRMFSGNFPEDGVVEFSPGDVPAPRSGEIADTWARFPYGVDHILGREGYTLRQGLDAVLWGDIPGGGNFYELTVGLNWKPTDCVTVRPELRFDHADTCVPVFGDGTHDDQILVALDVILHF